MEVQQNNQFLKIKNQTIYIVPQNGQEQILLTTTMTWSCFGFCSLLPLVCKAPKENFENFSEFPTPQVKHHTQLAE